MIGVRDPPPSAGSPRRRRCSSTRRDRRRVFLCGIGAIGLTRTSTSPFGNTPSKPKPSLLQRLRNLASLSRPFPREDRRAASQTSSLVVARSTPCKMRLEIEAKLEFADHDDREIVALQRHQIAVSNLALDDKAEPSLRKTLTGPDKGDVCARIVLTSSDRFIPCLDSAFSRERLRILNRRTESPSPSVMT